MPFYEYQCSACGSHHEELQKITARPLRKCPACGRSTLRRLVSAPVFRLKGGGWYETDFKGDKDKQRNIAGDKEPAAADGPPAEKAKEEKPKDGKADSKPADAKVTADAPAKPAATDEKPKPAPAKPAARAARSRRRPARR
jgi:putative FmdB family regulatory protein